MTGWFRRHEIPALIVGVVWAAAWAVYAIVTDGPMWLLGSHGAALGVWAGMLYTAVRGESVPA